MKKKPHQISYAMTTALYSCIKLKVDYSCFRSVGVVIYVMLSGVSPFLDESEEETSSNILRNDYFYIFLYLN